MIPVPQFGLGWGVLVAGDSGSGRGYAAEVLWEPPPPPGNRQLVQQFFNCQGQRFPFHMGSVNPKPASSGSNGLLFFAPRPPVSKTTLIVENHFCFSATDPPGGHEEAQLSYLCSYLEN